MHAFYELKFNNMSSERIFIPQEILHKIKETSNKLPRIIHRNSNSNFFINLSDQLEKFILGTLETKEGVVKYDKSLYKYYYSHYESFNEFEGISARSLSFAWSEKGNPADGAIKELRNLLCYFAFGEDYLTTLKKHNHTPSEMREITYTQKLKYKVNENEKNKAIMATYQKLNSKNFETLAILHQFCPCYKYRFCLLSQLIVKQSCHCFKFY